MPEERSQPELDTIDAEQIVWAASDGAVRIAASKPLLEDIRTAAYRAKFASRRAGVEIGGLLYGRRSPTAVELQGWASIGCGWSHGPAFQLTGREQGTLACLLDGLAEQLQAQGNEVVGWFVSRISGERAPTDSDADLHRHFFSTPDSLLLVLHPRREGDVWTEVHVYHSESQKLAPCDPIWVIDPAPLPAVDRKAGPPSARDRQGHPRASSDDQRQSADGAILAVAPLSRTAARPPSDTGEPGGSSAAARRSQHGSIWDSIPNDVWRLLALSIVLVIGCAAWLWLFQADVVRPLLLRWTSSASAPPSTISLTAKLDRDHMTVQWDGGSPVFLNPMSVQLIFEFVGAGPTTVPLRPDEAQRGYFATLTSLPPSRVTMIVIPAPGSQFTETFPFPAPEHGQHEAVGAAPVPGLPNPSPIK